MNVNYAGDGDGDGDGLMMVYSFIVPVATNTS